LISEASLGSIRGGEDRIDGIQVAQGMLGELPQDLIRAGGGYGSFKPSMSGSGEIRRATRVSPVHLEIAKRPVPIGRLVAPGAT
jgi:hypothetical protein